MSIINFIEEDSKKIAKSKSNRHKVLFLFLIISLLVGYGTREDYVEAFAWFNIIPSVLLVVLGFFSYSEVLKK